MDRTAVLQEIRMLRFEDVYDRFHRGRLSALEAAEWLGMSERTFRRQRARYEEEGVDGLLDRRLGRASPHRVPVDETARVESGGAKLVHGSGGIVPLRAA
ncbi:hypothetical protein BAL199_13840 [alpha proteobacterium BAL199]|nr:hypothetical protein BAL199_13840 [alpha proteobacterium BAL199]